MRLHWKLGHCPERCFHPWHLKFSKERIVLQFGGVGSGELALHRTLFGIEWGVVDYGFRHGLVLTVFGHVWDWTRPIRRFAVKTPHPRSELLHERPTAEAATE